MLLYHIINIDEIKTQYQFFQINLIGEIIDRKNLSFGIIQAFNKDIEFSFNIKEIDIKKWNGKDKIINRNSFPGNIFYCLIFEESEENIFLKLFHEEEIDIPDTEKYMELQKSLEVNPNINLEEIIEKFEIDSETLDGFCIRNQIKGDNIKHLLIFLTNDVGHQHIANIHL